MTDTRPRLEPGPDHPITIDPNPGHVTVRRGSAVIAETDQALALHEADYPPVLYIPLTDVNQHLLEASDEHTYCPFKGEASYYDIVGGGGDTLAGACVQQRARRRRALHRRQGTRRARHSPRG